MTGKCAASSWRGCPRDAEFAGSRRQELPPLLPPLCSVRGQSYRTNIVGFVRLYTVLSAANTVIIGPPKSLLNTWSPRLSAAIEAIVVHSVSPRLMETIIQALT